MNKVLQRACASKDLTGGGVLNAFRQMSSLDTGAWPPAPLNYSTGGQPPGRAV